MPFPNNSFDAVVATLVLCSVRDPVRVLKEIRRVLKPTGSFVFIEHVAAEEYGKRVAQQVLRPVCGLIGCNPTRPTGRLIAEAGFARVEQQDWPAAGMAWLPHIVGKASQSIG
jgi:ubiquinone/menaquinone biosynthesis C-methylase UbiE